MNIRRLYIKSHIELGEIVNNETSCFFFKKKEAKAATWEKETIVSFTLQHRRFIPLYDVTLDFAPTGRYAETTALRWRPARRSGRRGRRIIDFIDLISSLFQSHDNKSANVLLPFYHTGL